MGLARGRAARAHGDGARHAGPRRRLARRQRGRARPAAGRGHDRRRPALRRRSEPRARGQVDHLDPAAGAAAAPDAAMRSARSTSATARGARRCARPTPTASSRASARRSRTSSARRSSASCSRRPTSRGSTATSSAATSTRARARSTRTCCGGRPGSCPGHATPLDGLWHIGASTHPGPGLGAGSGYLVAKQLLPPPLGRRVLTAATAPRRQLRGCAGAVIAEPPPRASLITQS